MKKVYNVMEEMGEWKDEQIDEEIRENEEEEGMKIGKIEKKLREEMNGRENYKGVLEVLVVIGREE